MFRTGGSVGRFGSGRLFGCFAGGRSLFIGGSAGRLGSGRLFGCVGAGCCAEGRRLFRTGGSVGRFGSGRLFGCADGGRSLFIGAAGLLGSGRFASGRLGSGRLFGCVGTGRFGCAEGGRFRSAGLVAPGRSFGAAWLPGRFAGWFARGALGGLAHGIRLVPWASHVRCRRFARRRLSYHRLRRSHIGWTQGLHFVPCQRQSGMCCQGLLLPCESHWRRWRCRLGDHLPVSYCRWRRCYTVRGRSSGSKHALSCGSHRNPRTHRRGGDIPSAHDSRCSAHRLRTHESALWNRRYRTSYIPIHIRHIRDVRGFVDDGRVVDVRNRDVIDGRIADVDSVHILPADVVRGHINFPRTQRKPAHIAAEANASGANKDHKRRRINRPHCHWPGHPAPASADCYPASVVKRRVAP